MKLERERIHVTVEGELTLLPKDIAEYRDSVIEAVQGILAHTGFEVERIAYNDDEGVGHEDVWGS